MTESSIGKGKKTVNEKKELRKKNITHKVPIFISPWPPPFCSCCQVNTRKNRDYGMELFSEIRDKLVRNLLLYDDLA